MHSLSRFNGSVNGVTVIDTPLDVGIMLVLRPAVGTALICRCLVEVVCHLSDSSSYSAEQAASDDESSDGEFNVAHRNLLLCGAYLRWRQ